MGTPKRSKSGTRLTAHRKRKGMKMARSVIAPPLYRPGGLLKIRGSWKPQAPKRWPRGYRRAAWARGPGDTPYGGLELSPGGPTRSLTWLTQALPPSPDPKGQPQSEPSCNLRSPWAKGSSTGDGLNFRRQRTPFIGCLLGAGRWTKESCHPNDFLRSSRHPVKSVSFSPSHKEPEVWRCRTTW